MAPMRIFRLLALSLLFSSPCAAQKANIYPIQAGFVDANGVMIYYETIGKGAPLVIVHGGPGASHDYFLPALYVLARNNQVIFIDERGSGRSPKLDDPKLYTVENMVEDVEAVRQALNLGKISLLGHSYGGVLAQAYALKYQQNLSHLILASTFPSTREMNEVLAREKNAMAEDKRKRLEELEKSGLFDKGEIWEHGRYPAEYATLAWGNGYFPFLYGARPDPNYDPQAQNTTNSWVLYREMWGSDGEFVIDGNMKSVEYVDKLPTIKVPTLIIVGDHDECDPALSKEMNSKIAGSKLVLVPNSGHMTFEDQPSFFIKALSDFVNDK
jgi:proline iminopeptidase